MTSESEDMMISDDLDSPSAEEISSEGNLFGGGHLKKGPWTSAEDAILVDYVNKHGEGNWNAVQKHSGLSRCGKSCRLRWANHLRPDLKKGAFTSDEERRIIELHAKMGNKWARMAAELPGRTDNEIKNYWNTRIKRRQRAGLPIYPPDICLLALNENQQQSQSMCPFPSGDTCHPCLSPANSFKLPDVEFECLALNQQLYPSNLLDVPSSSLLAQGLGSSHQRSFMFSMLHPNKRLRESESLLPGMSVTFSDALPGFDQYLDDDGGEKVAQSFGFSSSCDQDQIYPDRPSSSSTLSGSHALLNGNSSSSEPISWAMKLELPSLQYSDTQVGSWGGTPSPLPELESVDTIFISPPTEPTQSDCLSPQNNGLLETVLYEAKTLKNLKNNLCQPTPNAIVMPGDVMDGSSEILWQTEWEACGDPISPLGNSIASVFSEYTPMSGSSSDEHQFVEKISDKQGVVDWVVTRCDDGKEETANQVIFSRPDLLLGSNWFGDDTERGKENSILTDAIGALVGDDFPGGCKKTSPICSRGSFTWDVSENH